MEKSSYYNPIIMVHMINKEFNLDYNTIRKMIKESQIKLNEEDIRTYLNNLLLKDKPDLKDRIDNYVFDSSDLGNITDHFIDLSEYKKYDFDPSILAFYKEYINILKFKCNNIIKIIDGLVDETIPKDILKELDINIDENGDILMTDVLRLIEPFIYNFNKLNELVKESNDLKTYYNCKLKDTEKSNLYLYLSTADLQQKNIDVYDTNGNEEGCISLTEKQKKLLRQNKIDNISSFCDSLFKDLFD